MTLLLLATGTGLTFTEGLKRWDLTLYDLFSGISYQRPSDDVVVIAIDEHSLEKYGRWPWPRRTHAALIEKLSHGGAKAIGYDVIFSEANQRDPQDDVVLAEALAESNRVILPVFHEKIHMNGPLQLTMPLPLLIEAAAGLAHIHVEPDPDGIVRRAFLHTELNGPRWPTLVLAMLQLTGTTANNPDTGIPENAMASQAAAGNRHGNNHVYIPFTGPPGHFPSISFADFLHPDFAANTIQNKFVLVGATALGLGDSLPTPVSGKSIPMPGVEYNANLLSGLLNGTLIVPMGMKQRLLLTGFLAMLPMLIYPLLSPRQTLLAVALLLTLTIMASALLLHGAHIWFPPTAALVVLGLSYPLWVWRRLEDTIKQLFREKKQAQVILGSIGDGVIATDVSGRVEYMNPVAETLTGYPLPQARGRHLRDIFPVTNEDQGHDLTTIVDHCLKEKRIITLGENGFMVNRMAQKHAVRTSAGPIHSESGKAQGVVLGITDVSDSQRMMKQMAYQATHDMLTGLPNRSLLYDRLEQIIARDEQKGSNAAVFFIDLDQFKKINDQIGHSGGDQLLKQVGQRFQACCRPEDTLAHLGSDKFVIALEQIQHADAAAEFAADLLLVLEPHFFVAGQNVYVTCSIGISLYPEDGISVEELLKNSDTAMYRAKECGRNLYRFFTSKMNERIKERLDIEMKLRQALGKGELEIYYQPQIRSKDGSIVGAESLLRWSSDELGRIAPARFIPVAEDCGLILPIGEWVIKNVCRQAKIWQDAGLPPLRVAVNLSSKQFLYGDIYNMVNRSLQDTGLNPACLELEITESLIMEDIKQSTQLLKELKQLGIRVSIDDFGTGYSSLSYLKHFPIDQLKIDKSFVCDIADKPGDEAITQAIITMAHGLGLGVIAEGVEHQEQLSILQKQGCDEIQGYFFSLPLPVDQMTKLLQEHSALKTSQLR